MPMYNLVEYSDNYSKVSGSLWQYHRDEPFLIDNDAIADFPADGNNRALFKFKTKIADKLENTSYRNYEFCNRIKDLCNNCRN